MDLDYLKKLVDAAFDEAEELNDAGPKYRALLAYLQAELPRAVKLNESKGRGDERRISYP